MPADDAIRLDNSDTAQNGTSHIPEDEQFSTANGLQVTDFAFSSS